MGLENILGLGELDRRGGIYDSEACKLNRPKLTRRWS